MYTYHISALVSIEKRKQLNRVFDSASTPNIGVRSIPVIPAMAGPLFGTI